jgi:hypothetical protein
LSGRDCWQDPLLYILRPTREKEEQFGSGKNALISRIKQDPSDLLADSGPAGLHRLHHLFTQPAKALC